MFAFEQEIRHAMLERLKRADEHAELLAGAQIFERMFLGDAHRANLFRSKRDQAITNRMRKRRETIALGADQRIGIEPGKVASD